MSVHKLTHYRIGDHDVIVPTRDRKAWEKNSSNNEINSPIVIPNLWSSIFAKNSNPFVDDLSFFVGPKGVGKSTLLHTKRALVEGWVKGFEKQANTICLPLQDERLSFPSPSEQRIRVPSDSPQGKIYARLEAWIALWRLLLATLVIQADLDRRTKSAASVGRQQDDATLRPSAPQLPAFLREVFQPPGGRIEPTDLVRCIDNVVSKAMTEAQLRTLYDQEVLPTLREIVKPTKYCLFVDAMDETLHGDEGQLFNIIQNGWLQTPKQDDQSERKLRFEQNYNVWTNAQAGLVLAANGLFHDTNHRLKVFSSIRSEAMPAAALTIAKSQLTTCAPVEYSIDKLETIIRLNMAIDLEATGIEKIFSDDGTVTAATLDKVERKFMGGDGTYLPSTGTGSPRRWVSEMVRLSMERPREIMIIGLGICRSAAANLPERSDTEKIVALKNGLPDMVEQFLKFFVGQDVLDQFLERLFPLIHSNALQYGDLQMIEEESNRRGILIDHPLCKLYGLGLLGYVDQPSETLIPVQLFKCWIDGNVRIADLHLPRNAQHFLVHPALGAKCSLSVAGYHNNEPCLIGNGLAWEGNVAPRQIGLILTQLPKLSTVSIDGIPVAGGKRSRRTKATNDGRESRVATAKTRPNIFLMAWLLAMHMKQKDVVSVEDLIEAVQYLVHNRFAPMTLPHPRKPKKEKLQPRTVAVFREISLEIDDSHNMVIDVRKFLDQRCGLRDPLRFYETDSGFELRSGSIGFKNIKVEGLPT